MPCVISAEYFHFMLQDEICKSIAEKGGIDALLRCIDDSGEQGDKAVAKVCCSLLSKVWVKKISLDRSPGNFLLLLLFNFIIFLSKIFGFSTANCYL